MVGEPLRRRSRRDVEGVLSLPRAPSNVLALLEMSYTRRLSPRAFSRPIANSPVRSAKATVFTGRLDLTLIETAGREAEGSRRRRRVRPVVSPTAMRSWRLGSGDQAKVRTWESSEVDAMCVNRSSPALACC